MIKLGLNVPAPKATPITSATKNVLIKNVFILEPIDGVDSDSLDFCTLFIPILYMILALGSSVNKPLFYWIL